MVATLVLEASALCVSVRVRPGAPNCESGEMVYSGDLKSPVERHAGSSPASRTIRPCGQILVKSPLSNRGV
jgi:hypothetical protein